jgi:hypothetical protein
MMETIMMRTMEAMVEMETTEMIMMMPMAMTVTTAKRHK